MLVLIELIVYCFLGLMAEIDCGKVESSLISSLIFINENINISTVFIYSVMVYSVHKNYKLPVTVNFLPFYYRSCLILPSIYSVPNRCASEIDKQNTNTFMAQIYFTSCEYITKRKLGWFYVVFGL